MESQKQEEYSVTIPLLLASDKETKAEDHQIAPAAAATTGTSSFFNACFNGLNALSGYSRVPLLIGCTTD